MNLYPILEEYTKQLPNGIYVNKKAPSKELISELYEHSYSLYSCAVGSGMRKIVPSWGDHEYGARYAALHHFDKANDTSLVLDSACFHAAIRKGDMADARRLFDKITKQIKAMDQEDTNNLVDYAINEYKDDMDNNDYYDKYDNNPEDYDD